MGLLEYEKAALRQHLATLDGKVVVIYGDVARRAVRQMTTAKLEEWGVPEIVAFDKC